MTFVLPLPFVVAHEPVVALDLSVVPAVAVVDATLVPVQMDATSGYWKLDCLRQGVVEAVQIELLMLSIQLGPS